MPVITMKRYTREDLREHPDWLFVFGDNMERKGRGGQAFACRDEPNAVGIPTKWRPGYATGDFFTDADWPKAMLEIQRAFYRLSEHLCQRGTVVWPEDGIGTGRADLARRAPRIMDKITAYRELLTFTEEDENASV